MLNKDLRKWKTNLIKAANKLDSCWCHHQDGSNLIVNEHQLFSIVFNEISPLLKTTIKEIHKQTNDETGKDFDCDVCGITHNYGSACKNCEKYNCTL
jgi:hypothetical protein